jgi:hypothetical protein
MSHDEVRPACHDARERTSQTHRGPARLPPSICSQGRAGRSPSDGQGDLALYGGVSEKDGRDLRLDLG